MVLPAVLRDPALDPEQVARRLCVVRVDRDSRLLALARHLACAFGALPAALPPVLLPDHPAAARHFREDQAAAEFDFGIGPGRQGVSGRRIMKTRFPLCAAVLA